MGSVKKIAIELQRTNGLFTAQIEGKTKVEPIPMSLPDLAEAEIGAVLQVLETGRLSLGPQLEAFEQRLAQYVGTAYGIGVNSGTSGLHLCMIAAGVEANDLVVTTPFSFIASANCILYERAIPIFVDVDPVTGNINPALIAEAVHDLSQDSAPSLDSAPSRDGAAAQHWLPRNIQSSQVWRIKAILPVHAFGQPADMDPILTIAGNHKLRVIEDACEAIGAEYKGRRAGTLSDAAVFAFYPNKQMTTGEGGMIVTNDEHWAALFRSLRNQGRDVFDAWLNHTRLGYNYRLDELSAALGLVQTQRLDELLAKRAQVAAWYNQRLAEVELVELPQVAPSTTRMSWFVYVVRIKPPAARDEVMRRLSEAGIPSRPYFTPIHLQLFYREKFGYREGDFPVTEHLGKVSLALPFSGVLTEGQVDRVCATLQKILEVNQNGKHSKK
jgi:dTDP-4-amino-4,6-dideoxygalactose transaminase